MNIINILFKIRLFFTVILVIIYDFGFITCPRLPWSFIKFHLLYEQDFFIKHHKFNMSMRQLAKHFIRNWNQSMPY